MSTGEKMELKKMFRGYKRVTASMVKNIERLRAYG